MKVARAGTTAQRLLPFYRGGNLSAYLTKGPPAMTEPAPEWSNPLRNRADRRLPRIAGPSGMVIFGVTGDLAKRKLLPAIYDLAYRGLLPAGFTLVGFGRRPWSKDVWCLYGCQMKSLNDSTLSAIGQDVVEVST